MVLTNLTNLTSTTNFMGLVRFANNSSGGIFGLLFLLSIFIIMIMMSMRQYQFEESLLLASFFGFVMSIFLRAVGIIDFYLIIIMASIMSLSGIWVYLSKK